MKWVLTHEDLYSVVYILDYKCADLRSVVKEHSKPDSKQG